VKHGGVGVPEDGDELVSIDLRFDRAESRVATLVCERGAHWIDVKGRGERGQGEEKGEHIRKKSAAESSDGRTLPCTRQTSRCTCASANFRGLMARDSDGDVDGADGSGVAACTAVAIGERTVVQERGELERRGGGAKRLF
jgi:hypothetical protein